MGAINHPARQPTPPAAVSRVLSRFTRAELEGFVAVAIDLMDVADGDPEMEDGGDLEQDDDEGPAWIERVDQARPAYPAPDCFADHHNGEDAEDDDPAGGNVEDEGEREEGE